MTGRLQSDDFASDANAAGAPRTRPSRRKRATMRTLSVLPTMFTLGNALCGFLAIFFAMRPAETPMLWDWTPLTVGAVFIFLGMVFDGLDGRVARLTNYTSEMGGQLDSMADMVTCGVAPAVLAVVLAGVETPFLSIRSDRLFDRAALVIACIYVACAALRLARFNIENVSDRVQDHLSFKGLPSPGAAGTVASLVLLHEHYLADYTRKVAAGDAARTWPMTLTAVVMIVVTLLVAFAMVSRLRYVHVSNRYLRGQAPVNVIAKVVILVLLLAIAAQESVAVGFIVFALSAPAVAVYRLVRRRPMASGAIGGNGSAGDEDEDEDEDEENEP